MPKRQGIVFLILFAVGAIIGTAIFFWVRPKVQNVEAMARQRIIQAINDRFDADADLKSLQISVYPHPKIVGEGLSIHHKNWTDRQPLIYMARFTAETDYDTLINKRNHVDLARLEGVKIVIPRRGPSLTKAGEEQGHEVDSSRPGQDRTQFKFLIEKIIADGTKLDIEPKVEGKDPLLFDIQKLTLRNVGPGRPMAFDAVLTNAKPPGLISSQGRFGPWQRDDPRASAVAGSYNFQNADLSVFSGISGILSSAGQYQGVLQEIVVDGTTDVPKFALKRGGDPVHLTTRFHSVVNGTDGDTILDPVNAHFLHSDFICRGGVIRKGNDKGKTVDLYAVATKARMDDILRLVIGSGKPVLTGAVDFRTRILIPPGHTDVLDKLHLDGRFKLAHAEFTSPDVEQRLMTLSNRARGISKNEEENVPAETVASDFDGGFTLIDGLTRFERLHFSVPGAAIQLRGSYDLRNSEMKMDGKFRMQATLSETQAGMKHWLLKPFDRLFEKEGAGFEVPITVTGTRERPEISAETLHHRFTIR